MKARKVVWLPDPLGKHCDECDDPPVRRVWRPMGTMLVGSELCEAHAAAVDDAVSIFVPVKGEAR